MGKPLSFVQIELTNHCNYRCSFCPQSVWRDPEHAAVPFERDKGFMDFDLFRRVVEQAGLYAREINFSFFGEPMMHPRFPRYLAHLKQRPEGLRVVMNSNLSFATREIFEQLIDIGLDEFRMSLDAATAETYERVRPGKGCVDLEGRPVRGRRFETVCEKAEWWFRQPSHRPSKHVYTVSSQNLGELEAFVQRWSPQLGPADVILAKNVLTYGGKMDDALVHPYPCNVWDLNSLTVDWEGHVSPCNLDTNMDLKLGSLRDQSLLELHQSQQRSRLEQRSKRREISPCATCVDGNNWSKNHLFRAGDAFRPEALESLGLPLGATA